MIGLYAAQTLLAGALGVLVVVTALDLLNRGDSGVGLLNAASGVGGVVGALVAFALIGRKRMAADFGLGIVLWGAPLVLIGAWPHMPVALVALAVVGLGNTLVDVSGLTLLQRAAPPAVIGRVFGVLEMILVATIGLGAILAPVLIDLIGIRWSLVATGAFLPVLAALTWRQLLKIDAESHAPPEVELLAEIPIFAPLPEPTLERLAAQLETVSVPAGTVVIRQGDAGDKFYVVAEGELEVTVDGATTATLGRGDAFGEIALLRDVPRTATVTAKTPARLLALDREAFLEAVTASPPSARAADAIVGARLGRKLSLTPARRRAPARTVPLHARSHDCSWAVPSGLVTLLFTDIEGSTRLLHELGEEAYADALAEHRRVLRGAFAANGGSRWTRRGTLLGRLLMRSGAVARRPRLRGAWRRPGEGADGAAHGQAAADPPEGTSAWTCTRRPGS